MWIRVLCFCYFLWTFLSFSYWSLRSECRKREKRVETGDGCHRGCARWASVWLAFLSVSSETTTTAAVAKGSCRITKQDDNVRDGHRWEKYCAVNMADIYVYKKRNLPSDKTGACSFFFFFSAQLISPFLFPGSNSPAASCFENLLFFFFARQGNAFVNRQVIWTPSQNPSSRAKRNWNSMDISCSILLKYAFWL